MRRQPPGRKHATTAPYRPKRFGKQVGVDTKFVYDAKGQKHAGLVVIDFASNLSRLIYLENVRAATAAKAFSEHWVAWAGPPRLDGL